MADFCWDCCWEHLGVEGKLNDMKGLCGKEEIARVLCEGCGEVWVDSEGKVLGSKHEAMMSKK